MQTAILNCTALYENDTVEKKLNYFSLKDSQKDRKVSKPDTLTTPAQG